MAFGLTPIIAVFAYDVGVSPAALVTLRGVSGGAIVLLCAGALGQLKALPWKPCLALACIGGPLFGAQLMCYFAAVQHTGVQVAVVLVHVYPLVVIGLVWMRDRRALSRSIAGLLAALLAGVALVGGGASGQVNAVGVALALSSAASYALYIVLGERWIDRVPPLVAGGLVAVGSTLVAGSFTLLTGGSLAVAPAGWTIALIQGAIVVPVGIVGALLALGHLGSVPASFLGMLEPVVGVVGAAVILSETLTPAQWLGVLVVVAASLLLPLVQRRRPPLGEGIST